MFGEKGACLLQRHRLVDAGHQGHVAALGQLSGGGLVAELAQHLGSGADEADAGSLALFGEGGILGKKTVAGVDGVALLGAGDGQQLRLVQVGGHAAALKRHSAVGLACVQAGVIVLGIHRQGFAAQLVAGLGDADGDLAAVGDQYSGKRRAHSRASSSFFFTLPVAVIGSDSTRRISGTL